jgi:uncharacterized protein
MMIRFTSLAWFAILLIATVPPIKAASYDCYSVKGPQEKLICANPELSKLDGELGNTYVADRALLSDEGSNDLRQAERIWLKHTRMACSIDAEDLQADCLVSAYKARLKALENAAVQKGPFLFRRVDILHDNEKTGATTQVSYPQIDRPTTRTASTWNRLVAGEFVRRSATNLPPICAGGAGEDATDYQIMMATDRLISLTFSDWTYCKGAPHGYSSSWSSTWLLSPTIRPLKLDDILDPSKPWQNFLVNWTVDYIKRHVVDGYFGGTPICTGRVGAGCQIDEDAVRAIATETQYDEIRWSMTDAGLVIDHQPGPYALGVHAIETPWSDLAPYMRANAPVTH